MVSYSDEGQSERWPIWYDGVNVGQIRERQAQQLDNWDEEFDRPIPLPDGGELITYRDAGEDD